MFGYFSGYQSDIEILNKRFEKIVFTRQNKSASSNFKFNFVFGGLLQDDTVMQNGDIVIDKEDNVHLVVAMRKVRDSKHCTLYRCNAKVNIVRPVNIYENRTLIGTGIETVAEDVPTLHTTVNGAMRMLDEGLLPSTTKQFMVPVCDVQLQDRIVLDGNNYQVDVIDETKFAGILSIQVSIDKRVLK